MNQIKTHWRTSLSGVGTILGAIALAFQMVSNKDYHIDKWAEIFAALSGGFGLLHASDSKVTDTEHADNAAKIETNTENIDAKP